MKKKKNTHKLDDDDAKRRGQWADGSSQGDWILYWL